MKKMNKHFSALAIAALLLAGSISVGAASAYKEVTARQNTGMQVKSGDIELTLKDDNGNTYSTLYAHMNSAPVVSVGQNVSKGQVLGYVGSTGNSTGNHLHLEMKVNNVLVNVMNYLS